MRKPHILLGVISVVLIAGAIAVIIIASQHDWWRSSRDGPVYPDLVQSTGGLISSSSGGGQSINGSTADSSSGSSFNNSSSSSGDSSSSSSTESSSSAGSDSSSSSSSGAAASSSSSTAASSSSTAASSSSSSTASSSSSSSTTASSSSSSSSASSSSAASSSSSSSTASSSSSAAASSSGSSSSSSSSSSTGSSSSTSTGGSDPTPSIKGALHTYCFTPDPVYNWTFLLSEPASGSTVYWLNLTSQAWLTNEEVDRSIWWHYMAVIVPTTVNFPSNGLMYITGSDNTKARPAVNLGDMLVGTTLATLTQSVVTVLFQVPNQPIVFADDSTHDSKTEDRMISYTWKQFMANTSKPELLARLPMTKAVLKAMDATTEFRLNQTSGTQNITKYSLTGGSKRGWVTWLAAAVDPERVVAIVPMVYDELNFVKNIKHHWRAYGGWSYSLSSFTELNITLDFDTPEFAKLVEIEDPFVYNITQPKLIIAASGDEFMLTDNNRYYWDDLPAEAEKHYLQFPNFSHGLTQGTIQVVYAIAAFIYKIHQNQPRPDYYWERRNDGSIFLKIANTNPPATVTLYKGYSGKARRDFRLGFWNQTTNAIQASTVVFTPVAFANTSTDATYTYWLVPPQDVPEDKGWVGYNLQVAFPPPVKNMPPFSFSTATQILPDTLPFPECFRTGCYQTNFV